MHIHEIKNISSLRTIGQYKVAHYSVSDMYKKKYKVLSLVQVSDLSEEDQYSTQPKIAVPA